MVPWVPEAIHARFPGLVNGRQNEAPRSTREKTSGTKGREMFVTTRKLA